ncbi:hypothetical protein NEOKW01_0505 [Nematocida sp. AWRm80]|nr:hypothetical protein NEOKW01_0505 [Nematocida sp. AWRm80]
MNNKQYIDRIRNKLVEDGTVIIELANKEMCVHRNNLSNRYTLGNQYIQISTNDHLLKRGTIIGKSTENVLYLVRYIQQKEDPIVSGVEYFTLYDTTIVYTSGNLVCTIDLSNGVKNTVLEAEEPINECRLLYYNDIIMVACLKTVHRLDLVNSQYTKVRLKVPLNVNASTMAEINGAVHLLVTCKKGNIYAFESTKMEMIKSLKSFGCAITAIGFWRQRPSTLFIATTEKEIIEVDYLQSRLLKKTKIHSEMLTECVVPNNSSVLFSSNSEVLIYIPHISSVVSMYSTVIHKSAQLLISFPDKREKEWESKTAQNSGGATEVSHQPITVDPSEAKTTIKDALIRPRSINIQASTPPHMLQPSANQENILPKPSVINTYSDKPPTQNNPSSDGNITVDRSQPSSFVLPGSTPETQMNMTPIELCKSFESFKDSIYKVQTEIFKEIFYLKKKIEEIERYISK